jgi:ATP-dependent Clp protease ATP-binding subunit ClpC
MRLLEDTLAEEILSSRIQDGDVAIVDVDEEGKVKVSAEESRSSLPAVVEPERSPQSVES